MVHVQEQWKRNTQIVVWIQLRAVKNVHFIMVVQIVDGGEQAFVFQKTRGVLILNWINVEDKLPDEFQKVLVWRKTIGYDVAWIGFGSWIYDNLIEDIEVIAWMPLPEPPRMEEK